MPSIPQKKLRVAAKTSAVSSRVRKRVLERPKEAAVLEPYAKRLIDVRDSSKKAHPTKAGFAGTRSGPTENVSEFAPSSVESSGSQGITDLCDKSKAKFKLGSTARKLRVLYQTKAQSVSTETKASHGQAATTSPTSLEAIPFVKEEVRDLKCVTM